MSIHRPCFTSALIAAVLAGLLGACANTGPAGSASAPSPHQVTLASIYGDHAVLQRGKSLPLWGTSEPFDPITVTFQGQTVRTAADKDGRWLARLRPLTASSVPADLVVEGASEVKIHDVVVGEVWLCSGQSNMEFTVDNGGIMYRVANAEAEVAAANYPLIRQLRIERAVATSPAGTAKTGGWQAASPKTVGQFTAVGYFFARDIHQLLGVPVGIILSCWGGTPIESWMSDEARASTSIAGILRERWEKALGEWPADRVARYPAQMQAWEKAQAKAEATHTKNPLSWPRPPASTDSPALPGGLFNGMIAPLQPGALRGILWYQGESNTEHPAEYAELLRTLIRSWRVGWRQGDLPFYFVQLANFGPKEDATDRSWARLREAQARALSLPGTGMAVTIDIGDATNVHPANKQEVGRRLALIAEAKLFGFKIEYSGPEFASVLPDGDTLRVHFTHLGTRLVVHGDAVKSLEVAGTDRVFHKANGVILDKELLVSSPDVPWPVAVRYAWTNSPEANLYNSVGLPAVPFRTDNW
jgi:sialate O-acetylesterase